MGYVEIFRPDGTYAELRSGHIVYEGTHFTCDACGQVMPVFGSEITSADGLALIQLCSLCKTHPKKAVKE